MFKKAERARSYLKLAVTGPSGSGKTYSALLIAAGLGKKIAVIDTENGSASLYAGMKGMPDFDVLEITAPFLTKKYVEAMQGAVKAGYDVLIIDSITHQWAGDGGILSRKEKEEQASPGKNSYTLWAKYTPEHEYFKAAINQAPIHIIATMRSKQDYVLEQNEKGKSTPRKIGLAPIQRDGAEYEFTIVFDISVNHYATVSKDRTGIFDGELFIPSIETGEKIREWVLSGKEVKKEIIKDSLDNGAGHVPTKQAVAPKKTEVPSEIKPVNKDPVQGSSPKSEFDSFAAAPLSSDKPTSEELRALVQVSKKNGWTPPMITVLINSMGFHGGQDLTRKDYEELLSTVQNLTPDEMGLNEAKKEENKTNAGA